MIRILEALYLIYMFCFFETSVDFNVFSSPDHRFFKHLIGNKKGNRICPFGHVAIFALVTVLLFGSRRLIKCGLVIAFILSLMNLNALVYLIPVFVVEMCTMRSNGQDLPARRKNGKKRDSQKSRFCTFSLFFTRFSRAARFKPVFAPSLAKSREILHCAIQVSASPQPKKRQKNR